MTVVLSYLQWRRPVCQEGFDFVTFPAAFVPISLMPVAFSVPSAWR
jgi:hypothetical protein